MRIPRERQADIGIGLLVLLIARSLAEVFRLEHVAHGRLTLTEVRPFVVGALVATIALGGSLVARGVGRYRLGTSIVGGTIASLVIYRVRVIDPILRSSPALTPPSPTPDR
ncbi:MAG: hypothetical protein WD942_12165 [Dehalococcoidia bacterium]